MWRGWHASWKGARPAWQTCASCIARPPGYQCWWKPSQIMRGLMLSSSPQGVFDCTCICAPILTSCKGAWNGPQGLVRFQFLRMLPLRVTLGLCFCIGMQRSWKLLMTGSTLPSLRNFWKQLWTWTASRTSTLSVHHMMLISRSAAVSLPCHSS